MLKLGGCSWDSDGFGDGWEVAHMGQGFSPNNPNDATADHDGDGMPDGWEVAQQFDPANGEDGCADPDGDGLSNYGEYVFNSDPHNAHSRNGDWFDGDIDTDSDALPDGWEVAHGLNPFDNSDGDDDPDGTAIPIIRSGRTAPTHTLPTRPIPPPQSRRSLPPAALSVSPTPTPSRPAAETTATHGATRPVPCRPA